MKIKKDFEKLGKVKKILERQKYGIVGHSGVQVCRWTRNSLNKKGECWKSKFYGIKSARCCQFSPAIMFCENSCLHCWRPIEFNLGSELGEVDDAGELLDKIVEKRKDLMMGFKGNKKVSRKKFDEACEPTLFTMSLSGEPTLYPRLGELIKEIRERKAVSFLVTNGLNPEAVEKLEKENALPTQLTVSVNAPNEKLFKIWHRSKKKDAWKKFNETLELVKKLKGKTRRAFRMTLVKKGEDEKAKFNDLSNMSDEHVSEYVELIRKSEPDFIHVKAFMSVGFARERLGYDKMPWHYEVKRFAEKLVGGLNGEGEATSATATEERRGANKNKRTKSQIVAGRGWKILGESKRSCVVVLGKSKRGMKIDMNRV